MFVALTICWLAPTATAQDYRIAFAPLPLGAPPGASGIYTANPAGTNRRLLRTDGNVLLQPGSWSPDGRTIAYLFWGDRDVRLEDPLHFQLWTVDVATGARRRVVDFPVTGEFEWSSDGRSLAAISGFEDKTPPPDRGAEWFPKTAIHVVDVQRGTHVRVADPPATRASWSPDGSRLVYAREDSRGGGSRVWTVDRDGSNARQLAEFPAGSLFPGWSPDGRSIVAGAMTSQGKSGVIVLDVDSRRLTRVVDVGLSPRMEWTPDSRMLLVGAESEMVLASPDGSKRQALGCIGVEPAFSPDGRDLFSRSVPPEAAVRAVRLSDGTRRKVVEGAVFYAVSGALGSAALAALGALPQSAAAPPAPRAVVSAPWASGSGREGRGRRCVTIR